MKHFNTIIEQLIAMHKDTDTVYGKTKMFSSANELSFAISRLLDAQKLFNDETSEYQELTEALYKRWMEQRAQMPKETAQDLALCIINNTPLSKSREEIGTLKHHFQNTMYLFTDDKKLSEAWTAVIFSDETRQELSNRY